MEVPNSTGDMLEQATLVDRLGYEAVSFTAIMIGGPERVAKQVQKFLLSHT